MEASFDQYSPESLLWTPLGMNVSFTMQGKRDIVTLYSEREQMVAPNDQDRRLVSGAIHLSTNL